MVRKNRTRGRELAYKKRLLSRKAKTRKIKIVSRKEQPQVIARVKVMQQGQRIGGRVSSSWIESLEWFPTTKGVEMDLLDGKAYWVKCDFKTFEEWWYAHSKGTYFNYNIKDKFAVTRI